MPKDKYTTPFIVVKFFLEKKRLVEISTAPLYNRKQRMNLIDKDTEFRIVALALNAVLLAVHTCLLVAFYLLHVTPMFLFNIASVSIYALCFLIIIKAQIQIFLVLIISEILLHMLSATFFVGWSTGFFLYSFGIPCVIYYTSYIFVDKKYMKYILPVTTALSVIVFFFLYFLNLYQQPVYQLSSKNQTRFFIANSFLIFSLIIISLYNFTRIVIISESQLHSLADFDELTSVYTRRKGHEELSKYFAKSKKGDSNFCIAIMDVDNFKQINDSRGHDAGDFVLKNISRKMQEALGSTKRRHSFICRWGGDEFLIAQNYDGKNSTLASCRAMIQKIHDDISGSTFVFYNKNLNVSMTGGFADHGTGQTIDETFKIADENLYKGKELGKNCVVYND